MAASSVNLSPAALTVTALPPPSAFPLPSSQPPRQASTSSSVGRNTLSLGVVEFTEDELPSDLAFPIGQLVAVHQYAGGSRVVQTMGPIPGAVTWEGYFWGDHEARIRILRRLTAEGQEQRLSWPSRGELYDVVIRHFEPKYVEQYAKYTITVEVVRDAAGQYGSQLGKSANDQLASLFVESGRAATNLASIDPIAIPKLTELAALPGLTDAATAATQTSSALLAASHTAIAWLQTYAATVPPTDLKWSLATGRLLTALTLISKNLTAIDQPRAVRVDRGSFLDLAVKYCRGASDAIALMRANNAHGLVLARGVTRTITIPAALLKGTSST